MIYLDYSANTPADPAVLAAFCQTERTYIGNPNSTHCAGRAAQSELQRITDSIAGLLGVDPAEIIYTSGASESNNLAIKGIAQASRKGERHENRQHHANPELSLQETGTTDKIRQILKKEGIEIVPTELSTGLIAVIRGKHAGEIHLPAGGYRRACPHGDPGGSAFVQRADNADGGEYAGIYHMTAPAGTYSQKVRCTHTFVLDKRKAVCYNAPKPMRKSK